MSEAKPGPGVRRVLGGCDLGGTRVRVVVTDEEGTELARRAAGVDLNRPEALVQVDEHEWRYDRIAAQISELLDGALAEAGAGREEMAALGVGAAGPFADGAIVDSTNIKPVGVPEGERVRIPLVEPLTGEFQAPVILRNDCSAGVLGEVVFGAGRGRPRSILHLVYITLSTGFGGGVFTGGRLLEGKDGNAAEVGHFCVAEGGLKCGCGNYGCAEAYASGSGVAKNARRELINENFHSQMMDLARRTATRRRVPQHMLTPFGLLGYVDAGIVFEADRLGDPLAQRIVEEAIHYAGIACAHIANAYDPEVITLGGSLGLANASRIIPGITTELARHLNVAPPRLQATPLGQDVVLWGAVASAREAARQASTATTPR